MKTIVRAVWITLFLWPSFGQAESVPVLENFKKQMMPIVEMISPKKVPLDKKEKHGVKLAEKWKKSPDYPHPDANGSVKYVFGTTLPTLVCMPLQVCSIQLQQGEVVNDVHAGDNARWKISPATTGKGKTASTVIVVKPSDAGLTTNLTITTDRRLYTIKLVSTKNDWMPLVSFDYPDDSAREWQNYHQETATRKQTEEVAPEQDSSKLDFGYELSGDKPRWSPVRVYSDGSKTYIQFASADLGGEAPVLVVLGDDAGLFSDPTEQIVNYRLIGDKYIVDRVLNRAALIAGVGSEQTKVIIHHKEVQQ